MQARPLSLTILFMLIFYVLGSASGFGSTTDKADLIKEYDYIKTTLYEGYSISLMKNKNDRKDVVIYRGAIKKKVLNSMEHILDVMIKFDHGTPKDEVESVLRRVAEDNSANVVVINVHMTVIERRRVP